MNGFNSKIVQYADDTCITIRKDEQSLYSVFMILKDFEEASGLKVNIDKTEILRLGNFAQTEEKLCQEIKINWKNDYVKVLGIKLCNNANDIYSLNIKDKIVTSQTIMNIWMKRNLSLYGKCTIAKTFILSQFMYMFSVLPVIGQNIDKNVNTMLFEFLWDKKPDKIKRQIICSPHETGGIGYPNATYYLTSTKVAWVKRLMQNDEFDNIVSYFHPYYANCKDFIFKCNINKGDIKYFVKNKGCSIVYEIFYYASSVTYSEWNSSTNFSCEIIWMNSAIRIDNKPIVNMKCIEKGIIKVGDLMIDGILFLTYNEFVDKYGVMVNFLQYYSIIHSIRNAINCAYLNNVTPLLVCKPPLDITKVISVVKPQKSVYSYLSHYNSEILLCDLSRKWSEMLNNHVDPIMLSSYFASIYKSTIHSRLRAFMYKYFHMRIYLNPDLKRINISDTDACSLCNLEIETYAHLFIKCKYVIDLLAEVKKYCYVNFKFTLDVNTVDMLIFKDMPLIVRFIVFITFNYIYKCRLLKQKPLIIQLYREFNKIECIEQEIATKRNKIYLHNRKWNFKQY